MINLIMMDNDPWDSMGDVLYYIYGNYLIGKYFIDIGYGG